MKKSLFLLCPMLVTILMLLSILSCTQPASSTTEDSETSETVNVKRPTISSETENQTLYTVTIACETEGATIYYSLDGGSPDREVTDRTFKYDSPFTIDITEKTITVTAIAVKEGYYDSFFGSELFNKAEFSNIPTITLYGRLTEDGEKTVSITGSGTIYYTTDGSDPTTEENASTQKYNNDFIINIRDTDVTVKALAVESDKLSSAITTQVFEKTSGFKISNSIITGYTGSDTELVIPNRIAGLTITSIASNAFENNTTITKVIFSQDSSITKIGNKAFSGCTSLENIGFDDNGSFLFPNSIEKIDSSAFNGCTSLTRIDFDTESKLDTIGRNSFQSCSAMTMAWLPKSLTTIDYAAFSGCINLHTVSFLNGSQLTTIGGSAFMSTDLSDFNDKSDSHIIAIPSTVTSIGSSAFSSCTSIMQVVLPNSLSTIESFTFNGCSSLFRITVPESVTTIESNAFNESLAAPTGFEAVVYTPYTKITSDGSIISGGEKAYPDGWTNGSNDNNESFFEATWKPIPAI